jgi:hypothetical protein
MTVDKERAIPVVRGDISYTQYLARYLRPLKPCLVSGLTEGWAAAREWTCRDPATEKMIPNFSHLREIFGAESGCITFCDETDPYGELIQQYLPISSFIDSLDRDTSRKTYLKDFHFMRHLRKLPYLVPKFLAGTVFVSWGLM